MNQLHAWQAAVLGLVEGITEYLPVSSTGHLILASSLMGLDTPERAGAINDFNIVIQGGAILAVLILYWPSVARMFKGLAGRDNEGFALLVNLAVAFLPAAVLGLLLDDLIEKYLFSPVPVLFALAAGGVYMIALSARQSGRWGGKRPPRSGLREKSIHDLSMKDAFLIGLMQCVAMWPGTSRSMMTITGGVVMGLRPRQAAEFSFLLGLPTLGAATLYKLAQNLMQARRTGEGTMFETLGVVPCVVGLVVAGVSAAIAVRMLVAFLSRYGLGAFGVYRILLAGVLWALLAGGVVRIGNERNLNATQTVADPIQWPSPLNGANGTGQP